MELSSSPRAKWFRFAKRPFSAHELACDLNPIDSIFLILRRVGVGTRIDPTLLAEFPRRQNLATYLAAASHDLCGKPIPAPLNCHSAGRGTSVPTGNTDLTPL